MAGADHHQIGKGAGIRAVLPDAEPVHAGAFNGPGRAGPYAFKAERDGQGCKNDADDRVGFGQQTQSLAFARENEARQ